MSDYAILKEMPFLKDLTPQQLGAGPVNAIKGFTAEFNAVGHNQNTNQVTFKLDQEKAKADLKRIEKDKEGLKPTAKKPAALDTASENKFSPTANRAMTNAASWYNRADEKAMKMPGVQRIMKMHQRYVPQPAARRRLDPRQRAMLLRRMQIEHMMRNDKFEKPLDQLPVVAQMMRRAEARSFNALKAAPAAATPAPKAARMQPMRPKPRNWAMIGPPGFAYA